MNRKSGLLIAAALLLSSSLAFGATWQVPGDFPTIQAAIDSALVSHGDRIQVEPGEHDGAFVSKSVEINGEGGAIISNGPPHSLGLSQGFRIVAGGEGATISHFTITADLAIMNGESVDNVTVTQCTFLNTVQAISNWKGTGWEISHNTITDLRTLCGGGIGILISDLDFEDGGVMDSTVSHNRISGTLHVSAGDCGGYSGAGIVHFADFRIGSTGTESIDFNRFVDNYVSLSSDAPDFVDVVALELTEAEAPISTPRRSWAFTPDGVEE
ncbi:MAG: hypothetical protein IIB38_04270 [Candidatus Hydrogenedentes bacterium]|nr:hypothetical protein [Candidatus Hydrogenedentota bacterium]